MLDLRYMAFDLPLKHVFQISRGAVSVQPTFVVQLSEGGAYGYGEATTNDYYQATIDQLSAAVERVRPLVESGSADDLDSLLASLDEELNQGVADRFALCAIDLALHDLWGKRHGQPLHELWGLNPSTAPVSNYTIGIDSVPKMVEKLHEVAEWPIFKIKLGTTRDLEIIRELRSQTDAVFRVDANCGWTASQAIELSHALRELNVEFIEQPLPAENKQDAEKVYRESALPVVADESCVLESDVDDCHERFDAINIKLVKCGGLAPARRMIARARELGMRVMVGCMTESTIGISAVAQVAPLLDYVDMDGAALLARDIATGVRVEAGRAIFPSMAGSGVEMIDGPF